MKKKFLSLIFGMFMFVFSIFSLTGCSLVKTNTEELNKEPTIKVGDVTLTRSDILSSFYTYYQSNSSYFAYYDDDVIEESFYTWATIREILNQKSGDALYDPETNPDGYIFYTKKTEKEVWELTFEYIYSQISTNEKAIYALNGYEEDDYPIWLRSDDDEDETTEFAPYESSKPEEPDADRAENYAKKSTDEEIKAKIDDLKKYLFEYVYEESDDEDVDDVRADIDETNYIQGARNQAYAKYIESLVTSAKSNGTSTDEKTLLENELIRVYNAYYKSELTTLFQTYCLEELLLKSDEMSDKAIVKAYLNQYFSDKQVYQVENSYISTITSTDGASLVLYHYNGQNYFFTVQQVLIKFDDAASDLLTKLPGYTSSSSNDYDEDIYKVFSEERKKLATERDDAGAMLTTINEKSGVLSINIKGNYYYYDESLKNDASQNYGYIKLSTATINENGVETTIYYQDNGSVSGSYDADDKVYDKSEISYMASKQDVLDAYESSYRDLKTIAASYIDALKNKTSLQDIRDNYTNIEDYIFDTIENMYNSGSSVSEINQKLASYLFLELEWVYSSDSLANEISNKIGYVISNYADENSSWVTEFAVGARELLSQYTDEQIQGFIESGDVSKLVSTVISNYGYHLIKIENVYKASGDEGLSLVDMTGLLEDVDLDNAEYVQKVVEKLKTTYVSTSSNETIYDYFYDKLYTSLAGSSSSSGTYFLKLEYEWLHDYYTAGKIEFVNKLTYDELMDNFS